MGNCFSMFKNRYQDSDSKQKYTNRNANQNTNWNTNRNINKIRVISVIPADENSPRKIIYDSNDLERVYEICRNI